MGPECAKIKHVGPIAEPQRAFEIVDPGERYDARERERIGSAEGTALGQVPAGGEPKA